MKLNISTMSFIATMLLGAATFTSCSDGDDFDYNKKGIFVTGTETNTLVKFKVEDTPSTYTLTAQTTKKAESDITVDFNIDNSLVDEYNAIHGSSFFAAPEGTVEIENPEVTIKAGSALSSTAQVKVVSTEGWDDSRTYVIPVTIKNVSGASGESVIEASRTIYLKVSRTMQFTSLVNNLSFSSNYIFDDSKAVNLTNFTFEIKFRADRFGSRGGQIERLCSFTEKNETNSSMLRFGENGMDGNQLQWVSPVGSIPSDTRFQAGRWYKVSLVYDGSAMTMYVDGVKDASTTASGKTVKFQRFELGMSWGGYNSGQFFPGRIAEVRVWNRALSATEMQNGLCAVDPQSDGLVAYWKMNEGEGSVFKDSSNHGMDMDWNDTWRADYEGDLIHHTDYGNHLQWANDELNKCAQ